MEEENKKLQNELKLLKENELKINDYEKTMENLSKRLEELLT